MSEKLEKSEHVINADNEEPQRKAAEPQTNHIALKALSQGPLELEAPPNGPLVANREEVNQEVALEVPSLEEDAGKAPSSRGTAEEEVFAQGSDSRPPSRAPSRGPSRGPSLSRGPPSRPPSTVPNGSLPEVNGIGGGVGLMPVSRGPTPRMESSVQAHRKNTLEQVEHWVKVQRDEQRA